MTCELRKQLMAWMEMDYSKHTYFRWKIRWWLEYLGLLGTMGETALLNSVITQKQVKQQNPFTMSVFSVINTQHVGRTRENVENHQAAICKQVTFKKNICKISDVYNQLNLQYPTQIRVREAMDGTRGSELVKDSILPTQLMYFLYYRLGELNLN